MPTTRTPAAKPVATETKKSLETATQLKSPARRTRQSTQAAAKPTSETLAKPKAEKAVKVEKEKLVRDRFTIPKTEYAVLDELKQRSENLVHPVKKSELLRAGVKALAGLSDAAFLSALDALPTIKAKKTKASSR